MFRERTAKFKAEARVLLEGFDRRISELEKRLDEGVAGLDKKV